MAAPMLEVRRSGPGRGYGLFATKDIPASSVVLVSGALFDTEAPQRGAAGAFGTRQLLVKAVLACDANRKLLRTACQLSPDSDNFAYAVQQLHHHQHAADALLADALFAPFAPLEQRLLAPRLAADAARAGKAAGAAAGAQDSDVAAVAERILEAVAESTSTTTSNVSGLDVRAALPEGVRVAALRATLAHTRAISVAPYLHPIPLPGARKGPCAAAPASAQPLPAADGVAMEAAAAASPRALAAAARCYPPSSMRTSLRALEALEEVAPGLSRTDLFRLSLLVRFNAIDLVHAPLAAAATADASSGKGEAEGRGRGGAGEQGDERRAVFLLGSLLNHSCAPNAIWTTLDRADAGRIPGLAAAGNRWVHVPEAAVPDVGLVEAAEIGIGRGDWGAGAGVGSAVAPSSGSVLVVEAGRDIRAGEEVTIGYRARLDLCAARRTALATTYGFLCECEQCAAPMHPAPLQAARAPGAGVAASGAAGSASVAAVSPAPRWLAALSAARFESRAAGSAGAAAPPRASPQPPPHATWLERTEYAAAWLQWFGEGEAEGEGKGQEDAPSAAFTASPSTPTPTSASSTLVTARAAWADARMAGWRCVGATSSALLAVIDAFEARAAASRSPILASPSSTSTSTSAEAMSAMSEAARETRAALAAADSMTDLAPHLSHAQRAAAFGDAVAPLGPDSVRVAAARGSCDGVGVFATIPVDVDETDDVDASADAAGAKTRQQTAPGAVLACATCSRAVPAVPAHLFLGWANAALSALLDRIERAAPALALAPASTCQGGLPAGVCTAERAALVGGVSADALAARPLAWRATLDAGREVDGLIDDFGRLLLPQHLLLRRALAIQQRAAALLHLPLASFASLRHIARLTDALVPARSPALLPLLMTALAQGSALLSALLAPASRRADVIALAAVYGGAELPQGSTPTLASAPPVPLRLVGSLCLLAARAAFSPMRGEPRFQELCARYAVDLPAITAAATVLLAHEAASLAAAADTAEGKLGAEGGEKVGRAVSAAAAAAAALWTSPDHRGDPQWALRMSAWVCLLAVPPSAVFLTTGGAWRAFALAVLACRGHPRAPLAGLDGAELGRRVARFVATAVVPDDVFEL